MEMRLFVHHVQRSLQLLPLPRRLLSDSVMEVKAARQKLPASGYTYLVLVYLLPPQRIMFSPLTNYRFD